MTGFRSRSSTGAGSGIGRIAQSAAGALIVVTDMNGAAAHSTADRIGGRLLTYTVDVTDRGSCDAMVTAVVAATGGSTPSSTTPGGTSAL